MNQLDTAMEAFAEDEYRKGESKYIFTCALQNCNIEYPCWPTSSRVNFPLAKAAKKGWSNLEPGATKDPCPFEVASCCILMSCRNRPRLGSSMTAWWLAQQAVSGLENWLNGSFQLLLAQRTGPLFPSIWAHLKKSSAQV